MSDQVISRFHGDIEDLFPTLLFLIDFLQKAVVNHNISVYAKNEEAYYLTDQFFTQLGNGDLTLMAVGNQEFGQGKPKVTF